MMKQKINEIKKFNIEEIALFLFLISRFTTWVLSSIIGKSGIYLNMVILLIIYAFIVVKKIKLKDTKNLYIFFIIMLGLTALTLISATTDQFRRNWILSKEHGIIVKVFDPRKGIFALFLILMVESPKRILKVLRLSAYVIFTYLVIQVFLFMIIGSWKYYYIISDGRSQALSYNLQLGYDFIFCFLIFSIEYFETKNKETLILSVLAFFFSFYFGSRGIFAIALGFWLIFLIFGVKTKEKRISVLKVVVLTIFATIILVFAFTQLFAILKNIIGLINSVEIETAEPSSRTVDAIFNGNISESNGRIKLWGYSLQAFKDSPIYGHGIYGDRLYVGNTFRWGYSHNVLLEMMSFFGVFGIVLFIYLVFLMLETLITKKYKDYKILAIIFISMNIKLLLSDSFLFLDQFWMLIGIFILSRVDRESNKKKYARLSLILFIINIGLFINYLRVDSKRKSYEEIKADKPTAIVNVQGTNINTYNVIYKYLKEKNIPATLFINSKSVGKDGNININQVKEISNDKNWTIEDDIYYGKEWISYTNSDVEKDLIENNEFFEKNGIETPTIKGNIYQENNYKVMETLLNYREAYYSFTNSISNSIKSGLDNDDFYNLKGYRVSESTNINNLINNISYRKTTESNMFIFIDINISEESQDINNIKILIDYLIREGFAFESMQDIKDKAFINPNDRTVKKYIKSLKLSDFLKE